MLTLIIDCIFSFINTYNNALSTLTVGGIAWYVFWRAKKDEKQNAAIILVMDIRHAEQVVQSLLTLLEKGIIDRGLKNILYENNWKKYKHLFAKELSTDDFSAFNRFFDACIEISDAKNRMDELFYENIKAKTSIAQNKILNIENLSTPEGQTKRNDIINSMNTETFIFDPNDPKTIILKNLQNIGQLSNTFAFEKLKKIAGL
ncbi:MAG: hypothetical protein RL571_1003 [Pseudomonadota bacterium]|jgi:hypothetical protein